MPQIVVISRKKTGTKQEFPKRRKQSLSCIIPVHHNKTQNAEGFSQEIIQDALDIEIFLLCLQ